MISIVSSDEYYSVPYLLWWTLWCSESFETGPTLNFVCEKAFLSLTWWRFHCCFSIVCVFLSLSLSLSCFVNLFVMTVTACHTVRQLKEKDAWCLNVNILKEISPIFFVWLRWLTISAPQSLHDDCTAWDSMRMYYREGECCFKESAINFLWLLNSCSKKWLERQDGKQRSLLS